MCTAGPVVVGHISDFHPTGVARFRLGHLASKRSLGWLNLAVHRRRRHPFWLLERVIEDVRNDPPDHLVVGGDLANLGVPEEFAASRALLSRSGLPPERISAVPGNHDRYTVDTHRRRLFELYFGAFAGSLVRFSDDLFPFLQVRPGLTILGLCSGWPALPIQARGLVGPQQLGRLAELLRHPAVRPPLVVAIHHPPIPYEDSFRQWLNGLHDGRALLELLAGSGAVVLHGHRHLSLHYEVETSRGPLRVLGVPSASDRNVGSGRTAGYHRYRFGPDGFEGGERRVWNAAREAFDVFELPPPGRIRLEDLR